MSRPLQLPEIPEKEQTPLVETLLAIIEAQAQTIQAQGEEIQRLKDEVAVLKGLKKRPRFKPSKMNEQAGKRKRRHGKRAGSNKRHKTKQLHIHHEEVVAPTQPIPQGSRFKGYGNFVVQELHIKAHNTPYRLEIIEMLRGTVL